jgi:hypothetical protein
MERGKDYSYTAIMEYADKNDFETEELGVDTVGEGFIVLRHSERDKVISFVLTGASGNGFNGFAYTCVYVD